MGLFIFKIFIYLFVWLFQVLVVALGLSLGVAHGLESADSVVAVCGLSCSEACGILVPQPGIEPKSPGLQGGFLTTGPPM